MLRSELISDIREVLRAHNIDSEIADRHIIFLTRTKRAKYLEQREVKELGRFREDVQQSLFLNTETVTTSRISGATSTSTVLRTIKSIPSTVGRNVLDYLDVRTKDYTGQEIQMISKQRISEVSEAPSGFIYGYREDDGRVYFYSPDTITLPEVVVQCILEDPEDIVYINELTSPLNEYPITAKIWEIIRPEILQILGSSQGISIDTLNNKADDSAKTTQK